MTLDTFSRKEPVLEQPKVLYDWLELNYSNLGTKHMYTITLTVFLRFIYGRDAIGKGQEHPKQKDREKLKATRVDDINQRVSQYVQELEKDRPFLLDLKNFLTWCINSGLSPKYIGVLFGQLRVFFASQNPKATISPDDLKAIKRSLLPKNKAVTQDDILSKQQLKTVLEHTTIHTRALALFLVSTGARIEESCRLKMSDVRLDADPPEVNIRNEYTKGGVGGRVMWFSYEARDAIREWHKDRLTRQIPGQRGKLYDKTSVFNSNKTTFAEVWRCALVRADGNCVPPVLARRDQNSNKSIHVYHLHTLRKFFITTMSKGGCPDVYWQGWVAHTGYLAAEYSRLSNEDKRETYKKYVHLVTIEQLSQDDRDKQEYEKKEAEWEKIREGLRDDKTKTNAALEIYTNMLSREFDIPVELPLDKKQQLVLQEVIHSKEDIKELRDNVKALENVVRQIQEERREKASST